MGWREEYLEERQTSKDGPKAFWGAAQGKGAFIFLCRE